MPYLFAPRHSSTLQHFASSNVLLAFDYDGTLAPIAASPERARMRRRTRRLLKAVAERYPCVVISGRAHDELARQLDGIPVWHVTGNDGLEPWEQRPEYAQRVREWIRQLESPLRPLAGVTIEDKTYSVAIHYRRARDKRRARAVIQQSVRRLRDTRVIDGSQAVNLVPRNAPHKGIALDRARRLLVCDTAIYVGDDATDEDAFTCAQPDRLLAVRVGARRLSAARYHLRCQAEIDAPLSALLAARPPRRLHTARKAAVRSARRGRRGAPAR